MRRFWIEFEPPLGVHKHPAMTSAGCGVTALSVEDALFLLKHHIFPNGLPEIGKLVEDVDISTIDQRHVVPNMGNVLVRASGTHLASQPKAT